jgi:hypothetical protein
MITHFKKVLYLGSWNHIEVVNYFHKCNEFVLIDTQPRSEFDEKDIFYKEFYREKFLKRVIKKCKKYGFKLEETIELDQNYNKHLSDLQYINPHLLIFKNNERVIKYYISTNILFNMTPLLEDDIKTSDTLYVAGYYPDIELFKYTNKKMNFVGDNCTVYFYEPDKDENKIIINIKLDDYFDNYYLVWRRKSLIIICDSLEDINDKKHLINTRKDY